MPAAPPTEPTRAKTAPTAIGLASLARAVRRYSLLVFIFALLACAAGALIYFFLPLPKNTGRMIYFVQARQASTLNSGVWEERDQANYRALQTQTLLSRFVLNAAMSEPGVAALPMFDAERGLDGVQYLQSNLRIGWISGEHLQVGLEGNEPPEILLVLNAVDKAYKREVVSNELQRRHKRIDELTNLKQSTDSQLKNLRNSIRSQLTSMNTADQGVMDSRQRFLVAMMSQSDSELQRLYTRQRELVRQEKILADAAKRPVGMRDPVPPELIDQFVAGEPWFVEAQRKVELLKAQLKGYDGLLKPGVEPPENVKKLVAELRAAEAALADGLPKLRVQVEKVVKTELLKKEGALLERVRSELETIKAQTETVHADIVRFAKEMQQNVDQRAMVEDSLTEVKQKEELVNRLAGDIFKMQIELNAPTRVSEWDKPNVFPGIEGNRRMKYSALGALGFLLIGVALAQWLEIRHRRIQHLNEVTDGLGMQILGTVPAMPKGGVSARSNWPHLLTEAVNTTRTMLLNGPNAENTKTLLITSAMSGEGKTSLTTHLAVSLATAGRRVLLIDADMRRPAVHKVLGLESKPGLAELLVGNAKLDEVTQTCKIAGLHLVPAGVYSREAAASLNGEVFTRVVQEASVGYDFVLIDSPPILPVADALAISKNVDGVLMSVMQDLSRFGAVQTACQRLSMVGANVLGVVVSGVKTSGGYYYYYYDERYSKPEGAVAQATAVVPSEQPPAAS